jgi:nitroreductase
MPGPTRHRWGMNDVVSPVLAQAARLALHAPSVFNTQPWRWRVGADRLELYADRDRHLGRLDPDDRLLVMSCGAALHHARAAIAAAGHRAEVSRWPDVAQPDLLARVRLGSPHRPSADELDVAYAIATRRTDRRAFADTPVPADLLNRLRAAAEAEGVHLHLVRDGQMPMLAIAAVQAAGLQLADPAYRSALIRWTNRPYWSDDGVPQATAVRPVPRRVPVREFAIDPQAAADPGPGHDHGAAYAILFGDRDDPIGWLRAGEGLSGVLLTAAAHGLSAAPMTDVVEVPATRELLRQVLAGLGNPYAALRIGIPMPRASDPPATPRRPAHAVIEYATG